MEKTSHVSNIKKNTITASEEDEKSLVINISNCNSCFFTNFTKNKFPANLRLVNCRYYCNVINNNSPTRLWNSNKDYIIFLNKFFLI